MTPQQQAQRQQQMQAQAQAMHQRADQSMAAMQAQQAQTLHLARQQQQQQGQTPSEMAHHQQLQAMQAAQLQQATNQMYSQLGLGQVNPTLMINVANESGLGGRHVEQMSEEEKVSSGLLQW
jgi:hypothetical protein